MYVVKKENIVFIALIFVIVCIAITCGYFAFQEEEVEHVELTDAVKIQEEYATYNEQVNENNNRTYPTVNLSDDNPFVYVTEEEAIDTLKNKTALLYFGYAGCPWCRSVLPVLESVAKEKNVSEIKYLDIEDIRSVLELDENNKVVTTREGTANYYKLLDVLDEYLDEYILNGKDGEEVSTGEKRIYAPTVIAVSNGEVTGIHVGSVSTQESGYDTLTDEEKEELKDIYSELIDSMNVGMCNEGC